MSFGGIFKKDRQVIPRWHTYPVAKWFRIIGSTDAQPRQVALDENYAERALAWERKGTLSHAADLVGSALVLNCFEDSSAIQAANGLLSNRSKATRPQIELAETFLRLAHKESIPLPDVIGPGEIERFRIAIGNLKRRVRIYPRNPILWMDLAFHYCAIGQTKAAHNAVRVAFSLNSENRYLLRSGSRFLMHVGTPDLALHLLRSSNLRHHDPWIVAAEIAISDTVGRTSRQIKLAKRMIESESISKFHMSELACALGTLELKAGSRKKGKKLFHLALEDPTENVLAQATSFQDELGDFGAHVKPDQQAYSFEAETRLRFYAEQFSNALEAAKKWLAYQPFSSRPAVGASYIASVALGKYDEAVKLARLGQLSSPHDLMLTNNLAFSLASLGKTQEARDVLTQIKEADSTESEKNTLIATRALIEFRSEHAEQGRAMYSDAVGSFRRLRDARSEAIAKFFWAREELRIKSPLAGKLRAEAMEAAEKNNLIELLAANKTLDEEK